jgi:hypothetical protein
MCEATEGCNAINYLQSYTGKLYQEYQLRECSTPLAPTWGVAGWHGYATFAFPLPPPAPPTPPPLPIVLLTKQVAATGAACLDGSPPGFYWEAGTGADANNWIVFLNGGGWCYELAPSIENPFSEPGPGGTSWGDTDSCWGWSNSALGSSNVHSDEMAGGGLLGPQWQTGRKQTLSTAMGQAFRAMPINLSPSRALGDQQLK